MTTLLFPNQLFEAALIPGSRIFLAEHPLFFLQLPFHKQKLAFHHASMRAFQAAARSRGLTCEILSLGAFDGKGLATVLLQAGISSFSLYELRDDCLSKEIASLPPEFGVTTIPSPSFLTPLDEWGRWRSQTKQPRMFRFYAWQRKRMGILMEGSKPAGGKWSFDAENRKPLPKGIVDLPDAFRPAYSSEEQDWIAQGLKRFANSPGSDSLAYPVTHAQAKLALLAFLETKLPSFGEYEDSVTASHRTLFHSQLSPLLNSGLLTPAEVLDGALSVSALGGVPLASLEGFIRQLIGWREFMSLAYLSDGQRIRASNALGHHNPLPASFWEGKTGMLPIDHVLKSVRETAYAHHIERLMILGVFMLLTETDPNEAYSWFFAMFIDAYDWVMVTNVYSMSQYADGGLLTTKPYLCGSSYLKKMADFPQGSWCDDWDALFWRWVSRHQELLSGNIRTRMSFLQWHKFTHEKQARLLSRAEEYLARYHG